MSMSSAPRSPSGDDVRQEVTERDPRFNAILIGLNDKMVTMQRKIREIKEQIQAKKKDPLPGTKNKGVTRFGKEKETKKAVTPFLDLNSTTSQDELQRMASTHSETLLNFEALTKALKLMEYSSTLGSTLKLSPDAPVQLDEAEMEHVKALLAEQEELSLSIIELENERLSTEFELMQSKEHLLREISFLGELHPGLVKGEEAEEKAEEQRNKGTEAEKRRDTLEKGEQSLNQMKFLLQKLLFAVPYDNLDQADQDKYDELLVRCGKPLSELTGDN